MKRLVPDEVIAPGERADSAVERRVLAPETRRSRALQRQLDRIEGATVLEVGRTMSAGAVAQRKVRETDALAREAMAGQAMMSHWRDALAGGDPLLHDEMGMFMDIARMAKGQIMTDLLDSFSTDVRR